MFDSLSVFNITIQSTPVSLLSHQFIYA